MTDASNAVCGVIATTLVITENTRLSCDVACENQTGPCIQFGKSNVTLWLNGFTMTEANDNEIKENVSVRNGRASGAAPCGGNCISNSNDNWVHRNHYHGNGSIVAGAPTGTPNDFGVGLVGSSNDNIIEDNSIGGNISGILIFPMTSGNVIRRNIIAGNPPVQLSATLTGSPVGVDIRDASPPGANTFHENLCVSYEGATLPRPCPSFPHYSTHH